ARCQARAPWEARARCARMLCSVIVLRARPFRSVVLQPAGAAEHGARIAKSFHHPNPWLALFDGARARREFAALAALEQAGLPVPHPIAVRRTEQGWELELAALERARSLRELLDTGAEPPGGWARLAARLGRVVAQLHAAGWEHGDLHAGNVLVDERGAPWLVDLGRARRSAPDAARALTELVHCAAAAHARALSRGVAPRARARVAPETGRNGARPRGRTARGRAAPARRRARPG